MIVTCRQLVEKVTEASEGHLSATDRAGWAVHLSWCRDCRTYVAQMAETVEVLEAAPKRRASDENRAKVLALLSK